MAMQQEAVTRRVQDDQLAVVECDVPEGWSLADWKDVRAMARNLDERPHRLRIILSMLRHDARTSRRRGGDSGGPGRSRNRLRWR
jgi:hypothetical protein